MMIFASTVLNVSAQNSFDKSEAEKLLINCYNKTVALRYCCVDGTWLSEYIEVEELDLKRRLPKDAIKIRGLKLLESDVEKIIYSFETDSKGNPYEEDKSGRKVRFYYEVADERFTSLQKIEEYISEFYASNMISPMLHNNGYEMFRNSEGGKELNPDENHAFIDSKPGKIACSVEIQDICAFNLEEIGKLEVNGNTAVMKVKYLDTATDSMTRDATVEFVNTPEGWRVSGGSFIAALLKTDTLPEYTGEYAKEPEPIPNPGTFDNTIMYFTIGAVALSGIVILFPKKKRT